MCSCSKKRLLCGFLHNSIRKHALKKSMQAYRERIIDVTVFAQINEGVRLLKISETVSINHRNRLLIWFRIDLQWLQALIHTTLQDIE